MARLAGRNPVRLVTEDHTHHRGLFISDEWYKLTPHQKAQFVIDTLVKLSGAQGLVLLILYGTLAFIQSRPFNNTDSPSTDPPDPGPPPDTPISSSTPSQPSNPSGAPEGSNSPGGDGPNVEKIAETFAIILLVFFLLGLIVGFGTMTYLYGYGLGRAFRLTLYALIIGIIPGSIYALYNPNPASKMLLATGVIVIVPALISWLMFLFAPGTMDEMMGEWNINRRPKQSVSRKPDPVTRSK